jgi:hypothetical protein
VGAHFLHRHHAAGVAIVDPCQTNDVLGVCKKSDGAHQHSVGEPNVEKELDANADWRNEAKTGLVPFFFTFAAPESVLAVCSCKIATRVENGTFQTHFTSLLFAT